MKTPPKVKALVKLSLKPLEYEYEIEQGNAKELMNKIKTELDVTGLETTDFNSWIDCVITYPDGTTENHILNLNDCYLPAKRKA